eukprot:4960065-Amphidinium_carterae.3
MGFEDLVKRLGKSLEDFDWNALEEHEEDTQQGEKIVSTAFEKKNLLVAARELASRRKIREDDAQITRLERGLHLKLH